MTTPTARLRLHVRLRLLRPEEGGLEAPFHSGNWAHWNIGQSLEGRLAVDGARVWLESADTLAPGAEGLAHLEPLASEVWGHIVPGMNIPMHIVSRVIGSAVVLAVEAIPAVRT